MGGDHSRLAPNDIADLMRMTNFKDQELNAWYKTFRQVRHRTFVKAKTLKPHTDIVLIRSQKLFLYFSTLSKTFQFSTSYK